MENVTTNTQQAAGESTSGVTEPQPTGGQGEQATINNNTDQNTNTKQPSGEADINDMVKQAVDKERAKWEQEIEERIKRERDDAANLAKMSEKEKQKELEERQRKADAEERAKLEREKNVFHAERALADKGIPIEFAETLTCKDNEETDANIERFNKMFREAVTKASKENLKGTPPSVGGSVGSAQSDPFLAGFGG